jgi:hypothetical protein
VKQGCPLRPILFNICIDSILHFIKREENHEFAYSTEELPANLIQAYAVDIILILNGSKGLRSLVDDSEKFFTFLNIKLNPKKCEKFKIINKKEEVIAIGEERKKII